MSTVLACANLNFGRSADAHHADVEEMRSEGAAIICTQEDNRVDGRRERITLGRSVQRDKRGSFPAFLDRRGFKIRFRRLVWADVDLPGIDMVRVFVWHAPPRRMGPLAAVAAAILRRHLARSPYPWIVAADWNHFLRNDPCGLGGRFGAEFYGDGIDGFAVHRDLVQFVDRSWHIDRPMRGDGHPFTFLKLSARPTRKEKKS